VTDGIPDLLRALLGLEPGAGERARATPLVPAGLLLDTVLRRAADLLPGARVAAPFHVRRGRVDLAILHRDASLGVLLEPSEPFGGGVRTGGGSEVFDYAIALAAYPKDHLLDTKPPHVWCFRAFVGFDGAIAFALARAGDGSAPPPQARAALFAKAGRARRAALDGDAVATALVAHLEARHATIAVAREFPCGGSVADVAAIAPDELHLYEIKGASDAATRLALQAPNYDRVATTCTLVTTCNHRSFRRRVPQHWGLWEAASVRGSTRFMELRAAQRNPNREVASIVDLLGASDLRRILRAHESLGRTSHTIGQLRRLVLDVVDEARLAPLALAALARRARPA
jgi:hypothetical protein